MKIAKFIASLSACMVLAAAVFGQNPVTEDTLDWHGYYPLEVGNKWEWKTEIVVAYSAFDRREIIADTTVSGRQYFVETRFQKESDPNNQLDRTWFDTLLVRYDSATNRVVGRSLDVDREVGLTCDLAAAFGSTLNCEGFNTLVMPLSETPGSMHFPNGDVLRYRAVKTFCNIGNCTRHYYGVGILNDIGDGNAGATYFTFVRVGGQSYGEPATNVAVERPLEAPYPEISVYPNPTRSQLRVGISGPTPADLTVVNALGKVVVRGQPCVQRQCLLDVSNLASGVYFLKVALDDRDTIHPFVIVD